MLALQFATATANLASQNCAQFFKLLNYKLESDQNL